MKTSTQTIFNPPRRILNNVLAGILLGVMTLTNCISNAALIFSGELAQFLPFGICIALMSGTLVTIIVAFGSAFPFALAGPDSNASALLAIMASSIYASQQPYKSPEAILPTIWLTVIIATLMAGILLCVLGWFRLGRWIRFVPYSVVGGFMAGTGWLIIRGACQAMAGVPFGFGHLQALIQAGAISVWFPGLLYGLLLFYSQHRWHHYLILPGMLVGGIGLTHVFLWISGISPSQAIANNWLLQPSPLKQLWEELQYSSLANVEWTMVLNQSDTMFAMFIVIVLTILFHATGIELETNVDGDLDRELRTNGIANAVAGLTGSMVGFLSIGRTLLNYRAGANSLLAGLVTGLFCGGVFLFGGSYLFYLPKAIVGGFLFYIGLSLLVQWGYSTWFRLPKGEYAVVIIILIVIANVGIVQGIGFGIIVAFGLFIINYSRIGATKSELDGSIQRSNVDRPASHDQYLIKKGAQTRIIELQNYIFFGTAYTLIDHVKRILKVPKNRSVRFIVLDFRSVIGMDSSAVYGFIKLKQIIHKHACHLIMTSLRSDIKQALIQGYFFHPDSIFIHEFPDLDRGIEWCEKQTLQEVQKKAETFRSATELIADMLVDPEKIARFMEYLSTIKMGEDEVLFREGDPANGMYFLETGQVSILQRFSDGSTRRLRTYLSGTVIGEMGLYAQIPRSADVVADKHSRLFHLSIDGFKKMEHEAPLLSIALHRFLVRLLALRLRYAELKISEDYIRKKK
jgi:SulP family sulfate permease